MNEQYSSPTDFSKLRMNPNLHVKTKCKQDDDDSGQQQPLSPTAEYFSSNALSVCILAILEFEVPMDLVRLVPLVHDVFLPINPRFSSIIVSDKGVRRWERVEVNAKDHVKIAKFPEGLTVEEYDVHFDEYLTKIGMEPFPEDKPLWEIHVVSYPTSKAAGNGIFKLHHSLGDGYSLMGALLTCSQRADDPSLPLSFPRLRRNQESNDGKGSMNVLKLLPRTLYGIYSGMCDFGWSLAKSGWSKDDKTVIRSNSCGVKFHPAVKISTVALSLDKLKHIKTKLGVTINAILTGIIFLGARLYMKESGEGFSNSRSTVVVLRNTRNIESYMSVEEMVKTDTKLWGNQFAFLHIALPELTQHNYSNPLDFVFRAHELIMQKKNSPAVYLTGHFLEIIRKIRGSETAAEYVKGALKNSSVGFTSMIGPVEQMALANQPVKGLYFMATGSHLSLVITAMSYMGTLRIGIGGEVGFIDSNKFNSSMEKAYHQIYTAAMNL